MANRHSNKKLREGVRRRMAETGETYQKALAGLLCEGAGRQRRSSAGLSSAALSSVDLIAARYFGWPITLAVFEASAPVGRPVILRIPSFGEGSAAAGMPLPLLNVRQAGWQ